MNMVDSTFKVKKGEGKGDKQNTKKMEKNKGEVGRANDTKGVKERNTENIGLPSLMGHVLVVI